jgi:hypothetical protein
MDLTVLTTSFFTALGNVAQKLDDVSFGVFIWVQQ